jgi:hypothetical protein
VQDATDPFSRHVVDDDPGDAGLEGAEQAADEVEHRMAGLGPALNQPGQPRGLLGIGIEGQGHPPLGIFEHDDGPPVSTAQCHLAETHQRHQALLPLISELW